MSYSEIILEELIISGLSTRTTNKDGKAIVDIGNLFDKFFTQKIIEKIDNKLSTDIYCVYTDYENDHTGEYTVILGCNVSSINNESNLDNKHISKSRYRKYTSEGNIHSAVAKTWNEIWNDNTIPRKYAADFDIYGKDAQDPENGIVYTYLSVTN